VSHNAGALRSLCQRGIILDGGRRTLDGELHEVLNHYLDSLISAAVQTGVHSRRDRGGRGEIRLESVDVIEVGREIGGVVSAGRTVRFVVRLSRRVLDPQCVLRVVNANGHYVVKFDTRLTSSEDERPRDETDLLVCEVAELPLMPGQYRMDVELHLNGERQDEVPAAIAFEVTSGPVRGRPIGSGSNRPVVALPHCWRYSEIVPAEGGVDLRAGSLSVWR
jgi:lipopolysaccharide transport system ATP-binding protein